MTSAGLAIGAIAPHGTLGLAAACDDSTRGLASATQLALDQVGRRIAATAVDTVVLATPHGVHVDGHVAVITASRASGSVGDDPHAARLTCSLDRELALRCVATLGDRGVPRMAVSYGGNVSAEAEMPLDWGSLVPLWSVARHASPLAVLLLSPARELSAAAHMEAGAGVVAAARDLGRRLAFIASADQGHGHSEVGPYGLRPQSQVFDARVLEIVSSGRLERLTEITPDEVHDAMADSWWQLLMLLGALREQGGNWQCEVLAYEAPTYYGMLTAVIDVSASG